eukprot:1321340-Rhodomonas_salina.1
MECGTDLAYGATGIAAYLDPTSMLLRRRGAGEGEGEGEGERARKRESESERGEKRRERTLG